MEYVIGCVGIYECAYLLLNVLRVDCYVVFGVARLVSLIHDTIQNLYITVTLGKWPSDRYIQVDRSTQVSFKLRTLKDNE